MAEPRNDPNDPIAQFDALKKTFSAALADRVAQLRRLWKSVAKIGDAPVELAVLNRDFHSLAGSCGVFGHAKVGEAALELELITHRFLTEGARLSTLDVEEIDRRFEEIVQLVGGRG